MWDVVIATEDSLEAPSDHPSWPLTIAEEGLLMQALERRGARVKRVSWSNSSFDWTTARLTVLRSTWDYFQQFEPFRRWVALVDKQTRLVNPAALVEWNSDKRYLGDLERRGVRIPPTLFVGPSGDADLSRLLAERGWIRTGAVLKPAVSAGAFETIRLSAQSTADELATAERLIRQKEMLLQEYFPAIEREGETSLVLFNGELSHAIRKTSAAGDFRVQIQHGGQAVSTRPAADEVEAALQVIAACGEVPTYARVDLVRDREGWPCLMELELIEPDIFCRIHPGAAERFADALLGVI